VSRFSRLARARRAVLGVLLQNRPDAPDHVLEHVDFALAAVDLRGVDADLETIVFAARAPRLMSCHTSIRHYMPQG